MTLSGAVAHVPTVLALAALVVSIWKGSDDGRFATRLLAALALARRLADMDATFLVFVLAAILASACARLPGPRSRSGIAWLAVFLILLRAGLFHAMGYTEDFGTLDVGQAFTGLAAGDNRPDRPGRGRRRRDAERGLRRHAARALSRPALGPAAGGRSPLSRAPSKWRAGRPADPLRRPRPQRRGARGPHPLRLRHLVAALLRGAEPPTRSTPSVRPMCCWAWSARSLPGRSPAVATPRPALATSTPLPPSPPTRRV